VDDPRVNNIAVDVYDLAGERVYSSDWRPGATINWDLLNDEGKPLANGVYLYILRVKDSTGNEYRSDVKKLFILR